MRKAAITCKHEVDKYKTFPSYVQEKSTEIRNVETEVFPVLYP